MSNEPELVKPPKGCKTQPVNYVWQAKNELIIHDKSWAVFDLDGHAAQAEAFTFAQEIVLGKKVQVA